MTSEELVSMIHERYEGNAHVVLEQVPNGTGAWQMRWIDAAVFSLWPSKGLTRSAFEIKVDRSDFIRELQNSAKYKWAQESFHEFWFVAPKDVIDIDELPKGAGFMYPRGGKLAIKKHCARNDDPKLDDVLLAAFMRAAHKSILANKKVTLEDVLANSDAYKRAKAYEEAVVTFCQSHGDLGYFKGTKEDVLKHLESSTADRQLKEDRDQLLLFSSHFQRKIADLFGFFAIIANRSLLERDEFGRYIVNAYGGSDAEAFEGLKQYKQTDYAKRYSDLIEVIMEWGKIGQDDHK